MNSVIIDPRGTKTRVNRPPVPFECACKKKEVIVLPQAKKGVLVFECDCGREYKMIFNREAGNIYKI